MFSKILIANRGEIARRVIRTARRLGVQTVAVYSDADAGALHVLEADEAFRIGPPPAAESYLNAEALIDAAKRARAEAIHPGYGFLSENPDFVEAVEAAGMTFIGPSAAAIRAMGLKDAAKKLMEEAGVPVVPGYHGERQEPEFLQAEAERIGWPVLIKARAGGGGKGMRKVEAAADFLPALESAQREAASSFGDDRVLIEKYVSAPRHIEVQVFGDDHGGVVHLFERDCSLQRRHQKVIEEAPAPGMTAETRAAMCAAAVRAAEAIRYAGAGTIEFIVDSSDGLRPDRFYFMEMNTRLQVEHPVTEATTGVDLVEWQLRVAAGEPIPMRQEDIALSGWAMEARLYAEDAANGFLPATGTLTAFEPPEDIARVDSAVRSGDEISPFYDPMIAKIITHGPTRASALAQMRAALRATRAVGATTNLTFLEQLMGDPEFEDGAVDTGLIERNLDVLLDTTPPSDLDVALGGLAALGLLDPPPPASDWPDPFAARDGWRAWAPAQLAAAPVIDGEPTPIVAELLGGGAYRVETGLAVGGAPTEFRILAADHGPGGVRLRLRSRQFGAARDLTAEVLRDGGVATVRFDDGEVHVTLPDPLDEADAAEEGGDRVLSPMPGLVKAVFVAAGEEVARGAALMVLEAMKMEHTLTAPRDGVVAEIAASTGDQVEEGELLLALAEAD